MTPQVFRATYGFEPKTFLDYKAIKGDASDNIPGVKGIEKTGGVLISEYGNLETFFLYANF